MREKPDFDLFNTRIEEIKAVHLSNMQRDYGQDITLMQRFDYLLSEVSFLGWQLGNVQSFMESYYSSRRQEQAEEELKDGDEVTPT